ncbi:MAG: exodeoxyribonuclease VII small subunit [Oscillospiraceae bacterium]|jgi:exodeoxyribonuclease VII small subunit|nr:exodeoxyribonuclease VII small subunit [Oscillospiraceae bacterium]
MAVKPKKQADQVEQAETIPFEVGMEQLEALVAGMEAGDLSLEQTLDAYERGMALHARLALQLAEGERRVQMLQMQGDKPDADAPWVDLPEGEA